MTKKELAAMSPEERWTWMHADANAKKSVMPSLAALRDADRLAERVKVLEMVMPMIDRYDDEADLIRGALEAARAQQEESHAD